MGILPTGRRRPKQTLDGASIVVFGPPGIGKTTFAHDAEGYLFLETEPGTAYMGGTPPVPIGSWQDFKLVLDALEGGEEHSFRTVVVDTIDRLYKLCFGAICAARNVEHPSDKQDYGAGWTAINVEWTRAISRLRSLRDKDGRPMTAVFISHEKRTPIVEKRGSRTVDTGRVFVSSDLSSTARDTLHGACDFIFHAHMGEDGERYLRTQPIDEGEARVEAKSRVGKLPEILPLSWSAMMDAFNSIWSGKAPAPKTNAAQPPPPE